MGGRGAIEVAKTVLEVADVAWTAVEFTHHHHHHNHNHNHHEQPSNGDHNQSPSTKTTRSEEQKEFESLKLENKRLRDTLEQNLILLRNLSESPCFVQDCPPDLYSCLVATVDSEEFLDRLKSLHQSSDNETKFKFPFKEATGDDMHSAAILVNVNNKEPSWWVWVSNEMVPKNSEEQSGIDDESYIVITEEHVVDGVANFMARCIVSNPKAQKLTPEELQKTLSKALHGVSRFEKMVDIWHAGLLFYTLATWGLGLTGLYRCRSVVKLAARSVHATSKVALKALK